jgi:hypothetical protein
LENGHRRGYIQGTPEGAYAAQGTKEVTSKGQTRLHRLRIVTAADGAFYKKAVEEKRSH